MKKLVLILTFLTCSFAKQALGWPDINIPSPDFKHMEEWVEQIEKLEEEKRCRLEESNRFSYDDLNHVIDEKFKDLKTTNAILLRFKEDFRKVRDQDDQNGRYTKTKVSKIFKTDLYRYEYSKELKYLINHLWHDLEQTDISHDEKIFHLKNKITILKDQLVYLRDICIRKNVSPWRVFIYLYHTDIRLAVHKHNRDWDDYKKVLEELDSL